MTRQIITSPDAPTTGFTDKGAPSPLAQAIRAGHFLFVSGQGPLDPKTREVVSADIREQTKQTLTNLKSVLAAAGLNFSHVVNMRVALEIPRTSPPSTRRSAISCKARKSPAPASARRLIARA